MVVTVWDQTESLGHIRDSGLQAEFLICKFPFLLLLEQIPDMVASPEFAPVFVCFFCFFGVPFVFH